MVGTSIHENSILDLYYYMHYSQDLSTFTMDFDLIALIKLCETGLTHFNSIRYGKLSLCQDHVCKSTMLCVHSVTYDLF